MQCFNGNVYVLIKLRQKNTEIPSNRVVHAEVELRREINKPILDRNVKYNYYY